MLVEKGSITRNINKNRLPEYEAKGYKPTEPVDAEKQKEQGKTGKKE